MLILSLKFTGIDVYSKCLMLVKVSVELFLWFKTIHHLRNLHLKGEQVASMINPSVTIPILLVVLIFLPQYCLRLALSLVFMATKFQSTLWDLSKGFREFYVKEIVCLRVNLSLLRLFEKLLILKPSFLRLFFLQNCVFQTVILICHRQLKLSRWKFFVVVCGCWGVKLTFLILLGCF